MTEAELKGHVLSIVRYYTGIQMPGWMTQDIYDRDVARLELENPGSKQSALEFLKKYLSE